MKCASCRSASHHSAIQTRRIDSRVCSMLPRRRRAAASSTRSCSARIATCASSSSRISSSDGRLRNQLPFMPIASSLIRSQRRDRVDVGGAIRRPEDRDHQDHREREQRARPRPRVQRLAPDRAGTAARACPSSRAQQPSSAPPMIQRPASPTTCRATSRGEAPIAMRTPMSRRRCVTR